ncbi:MAG: hypothetical protein OWQ57_12545 [Sulfobacillus sp.]|nr:hypothetical protein [Sulfobacillus sp.]
MMWDQHRRRLKPVSWAEVAAWSGRPLNDAWILDDLVPDTADPKTKPFDREPWGLSPVVLEKLLPVLRTLTATPDRIWMGFCDTTGEWMRCGKADVHDDPYRPDFVERRRLRQQFCREIGRLPRFAPPGWAPSGRTYWLGVGPLESVYDLSRGIYAVEPFIWWPDDRAWCVFHDIDLDFSLLGTISEGSEGILNLDGVEAYEVHE